MIRSGLVGRRRGMTARSVVDRRKKQIAGATDRKGRRGIDRGGQHSHGETSDHRKPISRDRSHRSGGRHGRHRMLPTLPQVDDRPATLMLCLSDGRLRASIHWPRQQVAMIIDKSRRKIDRLGLRIVMVNFQPQALHAAALRSFIGKCQ